MNEKRIIIVSESHQRAVHYLTKVRRNPVNPNAPNVIIVTGDHDAHKLRGIELRPEDELIQESYPFRYSPELSKALRILTWRSENP